MPAHDYKTTSLRRRLIVAIGLIVTVYAVGTLGYYILGGGRWNLGDCAYMTVISISTVGYGEVLSGIQAVPYARLFTSILIITGAGVVLYAASMLITFLVEGEFLDLRRRRRMDKRIGKMSNHLIVCGAGRTGMHVIHELATSHWPFIVIDTDPDIGPRCAEACDHVVDFIVGDAIDDHVLIDAGIEQAYGVVAGLPEDKDNLYVVLTARGMNPKLRIIAKAVDPRAEAKLRVAGADSVVSVNRIGGMRLASEMIRPSVVSFLDIMMRDQDKNLRFEEIAIPKNSSLVGRHLAESDLRKERKLLVVAVMGPEEGVYTYSPGPSFVFQEGMVLVLIGETESVARLRESPAFHA